MKNNSKDGSRFVYFLHQPDEMRHPYENALKATATQLKWYADLDTLVAKASTEPLAVIIDIDCLTVPVDTSLEHVRASFPKSDLIALSSTDSAQLALKCLRSGFTDFLLKPTSPEELAWSIRKAKQQQEALKRLDSPKTSMVRAITQISSCTTPTLVRLSALEFLGNLFGGQGAAWLRLDSNVPEMIKVVCAIPKQVAVSKILFNLPAGRLTSEKRVSFVLKSRKRDMRRVFLPCGDEAQGGIFLWGIKGRVTAKTMHDARTLVEHSELSLLNLRKFEEIKQQTFMDDLTGLYNSRYLKFALTNAVVKCKQPGQSFSVLFIDVDRFKTVNDTYGHVVGSEFLVAIGRTIKNTVRAIDPVFRYGGDEFVVILQDADVRGAREIGERIRKHIERRVFVLHNNRIQTTVSIGIAVYPDHASELDTLVKLADEAMYSAKKDSRNAVHLAYGLEKTGG